MHTNLFAKTRKLHNLQLPILISKKSIISDMYHRAMYMYINFHKIHRFANTISVFKEIDYFRQASSYNVHVYQFLAKSG